MLLSDAIALGSTLLKPDQNVGFSDTEGCALEMAMVAIGNNDHYPFLGRWSKARKVWPWLSAKDHTWKGPWWQSANDYGGSVIWKFQEVCEGKMTLDSLISWVRSVEPPEPVAQTLGCEAPKEEQLVSRTV